MTGEFLDLVQVFDGLNPPTADVGMGRFCAITVPGFPACAVGKDVAGNPVLLVHADANSSSATAPLVLEHLSVLHLATCRVQAPDSTEQNRVLSVVRCTGTDRTLQEFFLRSLYPIIAALPEHPSRQQIAFAIDRLVDLFRQLTQSPRKTVAGLWGELLLISQAASPEGLLPSWHAIPEEHFDFLAGNDRIEVKTACSSSRVHHFSLIQLRPPTGTHVLIASLLVSPADGGTSINDLVDSIRTRVVDPELLIRLDCGIAQTLGQDWRAMRDCRFDLQMATQSLRFFDAANVPAVAVPLPKEVSGVHFRVDLSNHRMQPSPSLIAGSALFQAGTPVAESAK